MDLLAYAASCLLGVAVMFGPAALAVAWQNRRPTSRFIPSPCPSCHHTGGWHDQHCPHGRPATNVRISHRSTR